MLQINFSLLKESFKYFYKKLKNKVFISVFASLVMGVMDGFGLAMFLPLLRFANGQDTINSTNEYFSYIFKIIEAFGFSVNFQSILLFICFFFIIKGISNYISKIYRVSLRHLFMRKLRIEMVESLNFLEYKMFVLTNPGRIQNTITEEVERIGTAFRSFFWSMEQIVFICVYMFFAYLLDPYFAFFISIGALIINIIFSKLFSNTKKLSEYVTNSSNAFQGLLIQYVTNFKYLKTTGFNRPYSEKLKNRIVDLEISKKGILKNDAIFQSAREPLIVIVVSIILILQTIFLESNLGPALVSLLFFYRALNSIMILQTSYNQFLSVIGSMDNMIDFQKELKDNQEIVFEKDLPNFSDSIVIEELEFDYGNKKILKNISLKLNKNETIAFVGDSGSGKTTLMSLISGILSPNKGSVKIDGEDISSINQMTLRSQIGYVSQDPVIFDDNIWNNITLWSERTSQNKNKFNKVIKDAFIHDFIYDLTDKHNTRLGHNGINISGGQKQRIALARELFKDINILFMDEATSSLDSESEIAIQKNIDSLRGKLTIVIVAHRLSTIINSDRIILIEKGYIKNEGSYDYLIKNDSKFLNMVKLQSL